MLSATPAAISDEAAVVHPRRAVLGLRPRQPRSGRARSARPGCSPRRSPATSTGSGSRRASGPIAVSPPAIPKKSASARPRSCSANVCTTIASAAGNIIAPPAPWTARKVTIHASARPPFGVSPQSADARREDDHADRDHPAVADRVGEPAAEGEQRGQREQVRVDGPLDAGGREPELLLDVRRGDRDDRLVDERHRDREDHRGEDEVPRRRAGRRRSHGDLGMMAGSRAREHELGAASRRTAPAAVKRRRRVRGTGRGRTPSGRDPFQPASTVGRLRYAPDPDDGVCRGRRTAERTVGVDLAADAPRPGDRRRHDHACRGPRPVAVRRRDRHTDPRPRRGAAVSLRRLRQPSSGPSGRSRGCTRPTRRTWTTTATCCRPPKGTKATLFPLGADGVLGRDELIRLLDGGRTSLEVAIGGGHRLAADRDPDRPRRRLLRRHDRRGRLPADRDDHGVPAAALPRLRDGEAQPVARRHRATAGWCPAAWSPTRC